MSPLNVTTRETITGPVLEIVGELDFVHAPQLRELLSVLVLRPGQRLILDLSELSFCDSSGIAALLAAHNQALAARADLALVAVPPHTLRILRNVGLDQIFPLFPDTATATARRG